MERDLSLADKFIVSVIGSSHFNMEFDGAEADICWESFLDSSIQHGVAPLLYFTIKSNPQFNVPEWVVEQLKDSFFASFVRQAAYHAELEQLITYLRGKGIEIIVMKGPVLSRLFYPDPALRYFVDIDLLFKEKDWGEIRSFLLKAGYIATKDCEVLPPKLIAGEVHEHILAFYNEDGLKVELKLDPFDLGVGSRMIDEIWERSTSCDFGSFTCRSLAPEHQLLHLLVHLNQHGFGKVKWFVDIAFILMNERALDWELVIHDAKREGILAPIYFSLVHVCKLFNIKMNEEILDQLRPGYIKRTMWRSIWPEKDITNFSGIQYAALLFPKKVFSKWFIPNL
ncbi:MAG TPA: nucleotidyltransferase family protein, partial [Anaerolineae bacterium]|nr:nucleotidyltransferase family protein [Anaerolineae bacterium]